LSAKRWDYSSGTEPSDFGKFAAAGTGLGSRLHFSLGGPAGTGATPVLRLTETIGLSNSEAVGSSYSGGPERVPFDNVIVTAYLT
jgi:hypothetical protein